MTIEDNHCGVFVLHPSPFILTRSQGGGIRTHDLAVPNRALYQAELHPVRGSGTHFRFTLDSPGHWSRTSSSAFSARRFYRVSFTGNNKYLARGSNPASAG